MITTNQLRLFLLLFLATALWAVEVHGDIRIQVLRADNDQPIVGANITIQDKANRRAALELKSDERGEARATNLELGDYYVEIAHPEYAGDRSLVRVNSGSQTLVKSYLDVPGQEKVLKFEAERLWVNAQDPNDGAVTRRDPEFVQGQLSDRSLPGILSTVPGVNNNSVGQVHVRGDHKSVTFSLDGVNLPIPPASSTTPPIDPDFLDNLEVRTGGYNGSQSGMGGLVLNAVSDWGSKEPYFEMRPRMGTQNTYEMMMKLGGGNEDGSFNYFVGAKTNTTDMQFEAPNPEAQTLNNRGQNTNVVLRMRSKGEMDQFGVTLSHQAGLYGVPQTPQNFAAGVRQSQQDVNTVGVFSWKRKVDEDADLQMSLAYLKSRQQVRNNGRFTPFTGFDPDVSEELAEEGFPADPLNPGSPYLPTTLSDITQIQPSLQYTHRLGDNHRMVAGMDANFISSNQALNIVDAGGGGALPDGAAQYQARIHRDGFSGGMFFSHTVPLAERFIANYGARLDRFNNGLGVNTGQISPFVNLSYAPTSEDVIRLSYNRLFQAPPLELDLSFSSTVLPQRVSLYELSYERQFMKGLTGKVALVHKDYRDQIDIGQLIPIANIPLYAPVNFGTAAYDGIELSLASHYETGWNGFFTSTISRARPLSAGLFTSELPEFNDHDQRVQITAGLSHTWDNGLSAALDVFYGSGYPQEALALYQEAGVFPYGITGDREARFLTNLSLNYWAKKSGDGVQMGGSLQVLNVFDQRPLLNFYSEFSGTRFVPQRRILLNGMFRF